MFKKIELKIRKISGADPEISERAGRKPNSRKEGSEFDFSVRLSVIFLQISYKYSSKRGDRVPSGLSPKSAPEYSSPIHMYKLSKPQGIKKWTEG